MTTMVIVLAAGALAAVAAAGVARPFGRRGQAIEPADPLEDERAALVQALRDLDRDHESGLLTDDDHRALRSETEARAVAVLRTLEARDGDGELAAGIKDLRPATPPDGRHGRTRRILIRALGGALLVAVVVLLAIGAARPRSSEESITGTQQGDPIAFFQGRVRQHPGDVAARLDLADRYLAAGNVEGAIAQYLSALKIDPENPEARATLGFLLYKAGKAKDGLGQVNQALRTAPQDPEALYFKGVILLDGVHQPDQAARAFEEYLGAAPFGARRTEVEDLLARARRGG
jgi:cytochrome c-type biogenesis protein CcmI